MSNIFNQQLGVALSTVNSNLQKSELEESNTVQGAVLSLYHAHGLTSKNEKQLRLDQAKSADAAEQNKVASIGVTAIQNIVTASGAAVLDAANTTRSSSATAVSVQKAATALTNLAGNVATTLAVAASLDHGSKIQSLVKKANKATREAARLADEASVIALNLTIEASKSCAANVVTQANTAKTNVSALQKSLGDTFSKQQELITSDSSNVSSAITSENAQAGAYKTAFVECTAIDDSEAFINKYLNNNLTCVVAGKSESPATIGSEGNQFTLSFNAFKEKEDNNTIISEYRLMIVKQDDAASFSVESAKAVTNTPSGTQNYVSIKPSGASQYSHLYFTDEYYQIHEPVGNTVALPPVACDYNGMSVQRGVPYTFFVYVIYTQDYQVHYDDTNGLLSQPGPGFTLATDLPVVAAENLSMVFFKENGSDAVRIAFKVPEAQMKIGTEINLNDLMEFRAFIFNTKDKNALALNLLIDNASGKLFKLEQTYRAAEEKYQNAEQAYSTAMAQGAAASEILRLKNEAILAKAYYQEAKSQYNQQIAVVDALSQNKISDFRVDESIVEALPRAYSLVVTLNDKLPTHLKDSLKSAEKELTSCFNHLEKTDKALEELNGKVKKINDDLNNQEQEEKADTDSSLKYQNELNEKIALFETLYNKSTTIKSIDDAHLILKKLSGEEQDESELLKAIIELFKKIAESEKAEIKIAKELNTHRSQLKNLYSEINLQNARHQMLEEEIQQLNVTIEALKKCYEDIGEKDAAFHYYEAVNTAGDFTDNYGEVLTEQEKYCCLVLSAIKDTEPDAAPLFANRMSAFSNDVIFS